MLVEARLQFITSFKINPTFQIRSDEPISLNPRKQFRSASRKSCKASRGITASQAIWIDELASDRAISLASDNA
jgi:hypothetical protein